MLSNYYNDDLNEDEYGGAFNGILLFQRLTF